MADRIGTERGNMSRSIFLIWTGLLLAGLSLTTLSMFAKPRHPSVASLDPNSRALFTISMRWGDESWDPQTKFVRAPEAYSVANPAEAHSGNEIGRAHV